MPQLPVKIQLGNFGARPAAPAGGTAPSGRAAQPRPVVLQKGSAQARERFTDADGKFDPGVAQALNKLQASIADSTVQNRAHPFAGGALYQGVTIQGPAASGALASRPPNAGLAIGFMYFDTAGSRPLFYNGTNWQDTAGGFFAAIAGSAVYTVIEHGFQSPALGFLITNVAGGELRGTPRIVATGDARDDTLVQIWTPYIQTGTAAVTADIFVFHG